MEILTQMQEQEEERLLEMHFNKDAKLKENNMSYFMLNNLGKDWIYEAENEKEATKAFLSEIGFKSDYAYENYCDYCQDTGEDNAIKWIECGKYGFKAGGVFDNGEDA